MPPPLSQHLREFASRPHSWAVLARNLIPVAGVYAFGSIEISHFWKAFRSGYDEMPDISSSKRVRWDVYLLMLRAIAMFMMIGFAFFLVPLMAVLLTYFEIWPERVIGAVFGDPSRLWQYDPEKDKRS